MKLKIKFWMYQLREMAKNGLKEAQKLALAVLIIEFMASGSWLYLEKSGIMAQFEPKTTIIYINRATRLPIEEAKASEKSENEAIIDYIHMKESSRGQNNYSKCEAVGKINGIGYGIPGNGNYKCFDSIEDQMDTLNEWIKDKQAKGMSTQELLCFYNKGIKSSTCNYIADWQ